MDAAGYSVRFIIFTGDFCAYGDRTLSDDFIYYEGDLVVGVGGGVTARSETNSFF